MFEQTNMRDFSIHKSLDIYVPIYSNLNSSLSAISIISPHSQGSYKKNTEFTFHLNTV